MKKKINVIDLDHTLIPFDSFRVLVKNEIRKFDFHILFLSIIRKLRFIGKTKYKACISKSLQKKYDESKFISYASTTIKRINKTVLKEVLQHSDSNTTNLLISASPNLYVKYIINELSWQGTGSYFNSSNKFIHLFGHNKITWLRHNFPAENFIYNYAVSDSTSDKPLLLLFKEYRLLRTRL